MELYPYRKSTLKKSGAYKLNPTFYGPFIVYQIVGEASYELELLTSSMVCNVFHVFNINKELGYNVVLSSELPLLCEEEKLTLIP